MAEIGFTPAAIIIEPEGRDTAPAILAAALWVTKDQPDATLLIAPSDHVIHHAHAFQSANDASLSAVAAGDIVTLGITPTHAETGYGYLALAQSTGSVPVALERFIEKPDPRKKH